MPRIKISKFELPAHDPFHQDFFRRRQLVESLCRLALQLEEPVVLGITAPWGHGKSTVIDRLELFIQREHTEQIGFVKYDAFKNDFVSDIFISFTSLIINYLEQVIREEEEEETRVRIRTAINDLVDTSTKIGKLIAKNAVTKSIDKLTGGIVNLEDIHQAIEEPENSELESLIKERLANASQDKVILEDFTERLNEAVLLTSKQRIIFVIDELDRCRPDFSIEVLEKIKHFFSCEKVLFILVYNKTQLENSISHIYGVKSPSTYLQRFVDLECDVSVRGPDVAREQLRNFAASILASHEINQQWVDGASRTIEAVYKLYGIDLSLRTIQLVCVRIAAYCLTQQNQLVYDKHTVALLSALYVNKRAIFDSFSTRARDVAIFRGNEPDLQIGLPSEKYQELSDFLFLMQTTDLGNFGRSYNYLTYYLHIANEEAEPFPGAHFVERHEYMNSICDLLSTFSME